MTKGLTFVTFLVVFWAFMPVLTIYNSIMILANEDGYRKATYVVTQVHYSQGTGSGSARSGPSWGARGLIEGNKERFSLNDCLPEDPENQEHLERMVPVGTKYEVLYNPTLTTTKIQGETQRVLKYSLTYFSKRKSVLYTMSLIGFLPLVLWGTFLVVWLRRERRIKEARADRRRKRKQAIADSAR